MFLQLYIILPIVYNNNQVDFPPYINQSTFGIVLNGIIWTHVPFIYLLQKPS